ncbi:MULTISPECIES: sugar diacid recognition domain-containing protein [Bacillales]|jgi:carbohydrate diacid regulator|uniref:Carbohydrate diacid regulator n=1 Tax=Brevibacillus aydinogluensis TaxID=927786 RepID=A0AA48MAP3_9BACL|nr:MULTISPECIES: sugar diacid recognition domain-containing protein [Bacillales]MBR8660780.1 helix-turn-helix domain-containing protein [Brevibacillus sp. NL20B1]MDT3417235.1 carbohydrate diacid regulator [Brevibacillus aydinogluensis]UFJ62516.1 helix-turn-helix domain-containing protein [Anoxybacillus sediminis]CAJ1004371.1 Carbohydrate diacid regulator [Brevibacillus aydinogluensis]
MKLTQSLADRIVKRTMEVTNLNINVMDKDGVIISSSDPSRIQTFHQAARQVIATGEEMLLGEEDCQKWTGTKPGINMPIRFQQEIVGVIGISGAPQEVVPFGKAVKMMTEMMLQQAYLTEQMEMAERSVNFLVQEMISGTLDPAREVVMSRGALLGLDLSRPRSVVIIQATGLKDGDEWHADRSFPRKVAACFRNSDQVCVSVTKRNCWIVVTDLSGLRSKEQIRQYLHEAAHKLLEAAPASLRSRLLIAMGRGYEDVYELELSFKEAMQALQVLERFPAKGAIGHIDDMTLELLLLETPPATRQVVVRDVLKDLVKHDELLETLHALFSADLNLTAAAQALNIHRNTLLYRLDRIEEMLGRNPRRFAEAAKIKLALELHRLSQTG